MSTIAGDGLVGNLGNGGLATDAQLDGPSGIAFDPSNNIYIADSLNHVVREVNITTGTISIVAGNGTQGYSGDGSRPLSAQLNTPMGLAFDAHGNLYICDSGNNRVREVNVSNGLISTIAGGGAAGYSGDGGLAASAELNMPEAVALDTTGNLYISDFGNSRIREVQATTGIISTIVGNGISGYGGDGASAVNAKIKNVYGLGVDPSGNLYFSDNGNNRIRKYSPLTGFVTTVGGNGTAGYSGDGAAATSAEISLNRGTLYVDSAGSIYIADQANCRIRFINAGSGIISTIAGSGICGYTGDGGTAASAELNNPASVAGIYNGVVVIADAGNNVVRQFNIQPASLPSTALGASASTNLLLVTTSAETLTSITSSQSQGGAQEFAVGTITGCILDGTTINAVGTVCVVPVTFSPAFPGRRSIPLRIATSTGNSSVGLSGYGMGPLAFLTPGIISTAVGTGSVGTSGDGGLASAALIETVRSSTVDDLGNLYFADRLACKIRKVNASSGIITTVAGTGTCSYTGDQGLATSATLANPTDVQVDGAGNLYIADQYNNAVRKVSATTGIITTIAGNGSAGFSGDGGLATNAKFDDPSEVALDAFNNIYVVDEINLRVRKITAATGIVTTVAGNGTASSSGDGGQATSASFTYPYSIDLDAAGNLYIADLRGFVVRKVMASTGIISTVAGNGTEGSNGDGGLAINAQLHFPSGVKIDPAGNVLIADYGANRIRRVNSTTGIISTIAGNGTSGFAGDSGGATSAELASPYGVSLDSQGNLYIADPGNHRIRKIVTSTSQIQFPTATPAGSADSSDDPAYLTLSNIGTSTLTLSVPTSGDNPSTASNFLLDSATTCPTLTSASANATIESGSDCQYAIDFKPTMTGSISGSAVLTDNSLSAGATTATQTVALTGSGLTSLTSTSLALSGNPVAYGSTLQLTANVATEGAYTPTGTITFYDGSAVLGSAAVISNSASLSFTSLAIGTHIITAAYSGDTETSASASAAATEIIQTDLTTAMLSSSSNPSTYPSNITLTASVTSAASGAISGSILFYDGSNALGPSVPLTADSASFTATLNAGTHSLTASFSPTAGSDFAASTSAVLSQVVSKATANVAAVSVSPLNAAYGTSVALTQTTPTSESGSVTFYNGATALGVAPISNGIATLTTTSLPVGTDLLSAQTSGDGNNNPATSPQVVDSVAKASSTLGAPVLSPMNSVYGSPVTLTETVTGGRTGTTTFYDGATALGTAPIIDATAVLTTSTLNAGTHSIWAQTSGDGNFTSSTSPSVAAIIPKASPTLPAPAISPATVIYGSSVSLTETVAAGETGTVKFFAGGALLGEATVIGAIATVSVPAQPIGNNEITAVSSGDNNYNPTTSPGATETVMLASPVVALTASSQSIAYKAADTFTATVTSSVATPTGTVTFIDGSVILGTAQLVNGQASITVTLTTASNSVTASFSGNQLLNEAASQALLIEVAPPNFNYTSTERTPPVQAIFPGHPAIFSLAMTSTCGIYPNPVTFTVTGLPPGATYNLDPSFLPANNQGTIQTLSIRLQSNPTPPSGGTPVKLPMVMVGALLWPAVRYRRVGLPNGVQVGIFRLLFLFAVTIAALGSSGCGVTRGNLQQPQKYVVTVTATSDAVSHSIALTLIEL